MPQNKQAPTAEKRTHERREAERSSQAKHVPSQSHHHLHWLPSPNLWSLPRGCKPLFSGGGIAHSEVGPSSQHWQVFRRRRGEPEAARACRPRI